MEVEMRMEGDGDGEGDGEGESEGGYTTVLVREEGGNVMDWKMPRAVPRIRGMTDFLCKE